MSSGSPDDILSQLVGAFFQVVKNENWGKRDLPRSPA